jgi:hypothetical protein
VKFDEPEDLASPIVLNSKGKKIGALQWDSTTVDNLSDLAPTRKTWEVTDG